MDDSDSFHGFDFLCYFVVNLGYESLISDYGLYRSSSVTFSYDSLHILWFCHILISIEYYYSSLMSVDEQFVLVFDFTYILSIITL